MKKIPAPSVGRIVFYAPSEFGRTWPRICPAIVIYVDGAVVDLRIFWDDTHDVIKSSAVARKVPYGYEKPNHWWWPPRVDETIEVE